MKLPSFRYVYVEDWVLSRLLGLDELLARVMPAGLEEISDVA